MAAVPETVSALYETYKFGSHIPQQPLIDTLDSILPQIDKPHILVTSQKQSKLSDTLQGIATEISIESEVIDRDIGLHVQESLNDGKLRQWKNHPIKDKIINTLQDGAGGSFRWVSCQIDSLGGCSSEDDVRSALENLPRDLNHTYDRILKRIYDQNQRSKGKTAAKIKAALQWLAFARRPLLLKEIAEAAAIDPEHPFKTSSRILEPHFISDSCSSLVVITASTRRGYLTSERIQYSGEHASLFSFSFSETDAHSFIGRSCLRYLSHFDKPDSINSKTLLTFPLAEYSAKFWVDHYTAIGDNPDRTRLDDLGIESLDSESNSFKKLIQICYDLSDRTEHEYDPPLYYISIHGLLGLARRLLEMGANVNAQGGEYGNALQAAVLRGGAETVQLLLNKGADVNAQGGRYGNALQAAAWEGGAETVQLLLNEGADVNAQGGKYGNALQAAAWDGDAETVQLLLTEGADVNAQGGEYGKALQAAVLRRNVKIVQLLLNKGADVNAQGGYYGSALTVASLIGNVKIVNLLLDNGADVNPEGMWGEATENKNEVLTLLLSRGLDAWALDKQGRNCLHLASDSGDIQTIEMFLDRGLDPGALDKQGRNCLHHAASSGQAPAVVRLLTEGLSSNCADRDGWTPLHWAAKGTTTQQEQRDLIIRYLLDAGADPKLKTTEGWTPHSVASFHHQTKLLPLLAASECEHVDEGHNKMGPSRRHRGFLCDGCSMDIYGRRYECLDCARPPGFDFCFKCNYSVAQTHPDHKFEVFEAP
ncbi:MAG: hypothetical protein FRX48_01597 [Lasallia pustulata]|uniref:Zinc finger, ZZ-type n=1 Tax=Lasallia pustulata TaxID=136370 RepID=A0A5M8PZG5_9LECA|nr:MAG: hypothetical protein FRX48_01597 [Lasallia pustulata]